MKNCICDKTATMPQEILVRVKQNLKRETPDVCPATTVLLTLLHNLLKLIYKMYFTI